MRKFGVVLLSAVVVVTMLGCASKGVVSPSPTVAEPSPAPKRTSEPAAPAAETAAPESERAAAGTEPMTEKVKEGRPSVGAPRGVFPEPSDTVDLAAISPEESGTYADFMLEGAARYIAADYRAAATSFLQALGVRPGSSEAHYNLAKAHRAVGESAALVTYELERAVEGKPMVADALRALGVSYFRQRRFKDAEGVFARAVSERRTAENLSNLGAAQYMLERYGEAGANFEEALKLDPARPECYWYLAKVAADAGEVAAAKGYWKKAIETYGSASEWGKKAMGELELLEKEGGQEQ